MPPTDIRNDGGRKRSHQRAKGGDKWCPDGSALPFSDLSGGRQVVTPKSAPTAAVTAIASERQTHPVADLDPVHRFAHLHGRAKILVAEDFAFLHIGPAFVHVQV